MQANQYQEHASNSEPHSTDSSQSRQGGGAEQHQEQGVFGVEEQPEEEDGGGAGKTDQQESPLQESLRLQKSPHRSDTRPPNARVMNMLQVSTTNPQCPVFWVWVTGLQAH